ncbi:23S rRNA (guanosine-2'-O-) -methyltransferase rlmB [invertebrate metagenome]|uniref:23S rRNA (Guanosine-2'-O-) -methyltransferase rlmB n=1 Tax=invertebrate metagenome TaxID=1711999 RepID=A0A484H533_9ZZZZ
MSKRQQSYSSDRNSRPTTRPSHGAVFPRPTHQREPFWIYGRHATLAALANPTRHCRRLLVTSDAAYVSEDTLVKIYNNCALYLPKIECVHISTIEHLLPGVIHQGMVTQVTPLESRSLNTLLKGTHDTALSTVIMLDQITDPRNVGAVMRSAAAFGAMAVVMQERRAPVETGALARAASGSLEKVPLARTTNLARTLETCKAAGFWTIGLEATAPRSLAQVEVADRIVLVLGSEGRGLRHSVRVHCDSLVCLPITSAVESLNVSNAAAVALYEVTRHRLTDSSRK